MQNVISISKTFVFQVVEHFNQSKLMISGHFSSFSSFMRILVLVEKVVHLFHALSGLIISPPALTSNNIPVLISLRKNYYAMIS